MLRIVRPIWPHRKIQFRPGTCNQLRRGQVDNGTPVRSERGHDHGPASAGQGEGPAGRGPTRPRTQADGLAQAYAAGPGAGFADGALPRGMRPEQVFALQRSAGNSAVARMLARQEDEEGKSRSTRRRRRSSRRSRSAAGVRARTGEERTPDDLSGIDTAMAEEPGRGLQPPPSGGRVLARNILDDFGDAAGDVAGGIVDKAGDIGGDILDTAGHRRLVGDKASEGLDLLKGKIGEAFSGVTGAFAAIRDAVVGMDPAACGRPGRADRPAGLGLASTVTNAGSWFKGMVGGVASRSRSGLSRAVDPSRGRVLARSPARRDHGPLHRPRRTAARRGVRPHRAHPRLQDGRRHRQARAVRPLLKQIEEAAEDPDAVVKPFIDDVTLKLEAETPGEMAEIVATKGAEAPRPSPPPRRRPARVSVARSRTKRSTSRAGRTSRRDRGRGTDKFEQPATCRTWSRRPCGRCCGRGRRW